MAKALRASPERIMFGGALAEFVVRGDLVVGLYRLGQPIDCLQQRLPAFGLRAVIGSERSHVLHP